MPDGTCRARIWQHYLQSMPFEEGIRSDVATLARADTAATGADIQNICREAAMVSLRRDMAAEVIKREDLAVALEIVR